MELHERISNYLTFKPEIELGPYTLSNLKERIDEGASAEQINFVIDTAYDDDCFQRAIFNRTVKVFKHTNKENQIADAAVAADSQFWDAAERKNDKIHWFYDKFVGKFWDDDRDDYLKERLSRNFEDLEPVDQMLVRKYPVFKSVK